MSTRKRVVPLFVVLFAVPVWSKVFVRWTQPVLPPAERLGVHEIAIPWNAVALPSFRGAPRQGYRAYAEVALGEASSAAKTATKFGLVRIWRSSDWSRRSVQRRLHFTASPGS